MVMYYIHKPLNSHETTRRSSLSRFLSKKKKGETSALLQNSPSHLLGLFPRAHWGTLPPKEGPTRSGDDVRGDSCCRLLLHVRSTLSALSCSACRQWDDRPLPQEGFNKVQLTTVLWEVEMQRFTKSSHAPKKTHPICESKRLSSSYKGKDAVWSILNQDYYQ